MGGSASIRGGETAEKGTFEKELDAHGADIRADLENVEEHCMHGTILARLDCYDEAFAAFDEAVRLVPGVAAGHRGRGGALHYLDRHDGAFVAFDKAVRIDPGNAYGHLGCGDALVRLGRCEDAFAAFDTAVQLDPDDPEGHKRGAALDHIEPCMYKSCGQCWLQM